MRPVRIAGMAPGNARARAGRLVPVGMPDGLGAAAWLNGLARFGLGFHADLWTMHERAPAPDRARSHGTGAGLQAAEPTYTAGANRVPPMEES